MGACQNAHQNLNVNLFGAYAFDLSAVCDPGLTMLARRRGVCVDKKRPAPLAPSSIEPGLDDVTAAVIAKGDRRNRQHG
jgi:hypothetical protein